MKTISGKIESQRKDKTAIKINGMWLQFPKEATKEQMERVKWKDFVEVAYVESEKGNPIIQSIKMIGKSRDETTVDDIINNKLNANDVPQETKVQQIETLDTIPKEERALNEATKQVMELFNVEKIENLTDGHLEIIATLVRYKLWNGKSFA